MEEATSDAERSLHPAHAATIAAGGPMVTPDDDTSPEMGVLRALLRRRLFSRDADPVKIGRFTVERRLGSGGMGVVWLARDEDLDRRVAVKLLRPDIAGDDPGIGAARLLREAQAMARLRHDNVVVVHEVGEHDGAVFLAMEYVQGATLSGWLQHPHATREILDHLVAAGRGLQAAHEAGLVHRDFKPDNVLVGDDGRVCVTDFGLARLGEAAGEREPSGSATGPTLVSSETLYDGAVGTPVYMARECLRGGGSTAAADIFAFSVTVYQALWGRHPFGVSSKAAVETIAAGGPPLPPPAGPAWVWRVVRRGLSHDPKLRPATMRELLAVLSDDPVRRRKRQGVAAFAVAGLAAAWVAWPDRTACRDLDAEIGRAWNDERRAALDAAFAAAGSTWTTTVAQHTGESLDRWVAGWVDESREACEATRVRGVQSASQLDRRSACLDQQRRRLEQLVELLVVADGDTVEHATDAVAALPDPADCADAAVLERRVARPRDPSARARLERAETDLARGWAQRDTGKVAEARDSARAALAGGRAAGYRPVQTEAGRLLADALADLGETDEAESVLHEAIEAAVAGRDDPALARAWLSLAYLALWGREDATTATRYETLAAAAVEAIGAPAPFRVDLLRLRASIALQREDLEAGRAAAEQALALLVQTHADPARIAAGELSVGLALFEAGDIVGAREHLRAAVEGFTSAHGPEHPDTLRARNNLANVLTNLRDLDAAQAEHEAVLAARERVFGPVHEEVAASLVGLAIIHYHRGDLEGALTRMRRAYEDLSATVGPDASQTLAAAENTVSILSALSREEEAEALAQEIVTATERKVGPDHAALVGPLQNLARVQRVLGRREPAAAMLARAIALAEATRGPDHPVMVDLLVERSDAAKDAGDLAAARADRRRSVEVAEHVYGREHVRLVSLLREWADIEEPEVAVPLRARADRIEAAARSSDAASDE